MKKWALRLGYFGWNYHGFQRQPGLRTIEGVVLGALKRKLGEIQDYSYASRTDRGVSSFGNVISFSSEIKPILGALNHDLPWDVFFLSCKEVSTEFNARFALCRGYSYFLLDNGNLNLDKMNAACELVKGEHDFRYFCKIDKKRKIGKRGYRRKVLDCEVKEGKCGLIVLRITADSFLWEMARRILSAVVSIGRGELDLRDLELSLELKKKLNVRPLDPIGLVLTGVRYRDLELSLDDDVKRRLHKRMCEKIREEGTKFLLIKNFFEAL